MTDQESLDYQRIEMAIEYLQAHFKEQPSLDEVAEKLCLSPHHFQKLFKKWAGTSPKKFIQFLSISHAKSLLKSTHYSVVDATLETGLSSTSRLHDLFVSVVGMTPSEYKNGGRNLIIKYSYHDSPFGKILIASTEKGICFLNFVEGAKDFQLLKTEFPNASFIEQDDYHQEAVRQIFSKVVVDPMDLKVHLKGTPFQLKVWECLLTIPFANLTTYGDIAKKIGNDKASRAVGTAIGSNLIAFLIPCHRVIQSSGKIGGYKWGELRKKAIIGWESATNFISSESDDE